MWGNPAPARAVEPAAYGVRSPIIVEIRVGPGEHVGIVGGGPNHPACSAVSRDSDARRYPL
jgi:hypothetical protein